MQTPSAGGEARVTNRASCNRLDYTEDMDGFGEGYVEQDLQRSVSKCAGKLFEREGNEDNSKVMKVPRRDENY